MNEMSVWIEHLKHPLVLAGFGLFVFALIIKPLFLNNKKLNGTAIERLLHKGMILLFILAAMAVVGGIALNWRSDQPNPGGKIPNATVGQAAPAQVKQTTQGEKSPAINAQGDVEVTYGK